MKLELEVKGFIQLCVFLAKHPDKIIENQELAPLLDFCYNSMSNCDCKSGEKKNIEIYERQFEVEMQKLSQKTLDVLGFILDETNQFSNIHISFLFSDQKIKVK